MQLLDVRRLTPDDAEAYKRLRIEAARDPAFAASPEVEQAFPIPAVQQMLVRTTKGFVLGAFDGSTIVGMIGYGAGPEEVKGTLFGLFVSNGERRKGIGRGLLRSFISHLPESARQIELFVEANNHAAISLYRSEGFNLADEANAIVKMEKTI